MERVRLRYIERARKSANNINEHLCLLLLVLPPLLYVHLTRKITCMFNDIDSSVYKQNLMVMHCTQIVSLAKTRIRPFAYANPFQ